MLYRPIGNTGLSTSIIGLGSEHLDNKPYAQVEKVIQAALEQGTYAFCQAHDFGPVYPPRFDPPGCCQHPDRLSEQADPIFDL